MLQQKLATIHPRIRLHPTHLKLLLKTSKHCRQFAPSLYCASRRGKRPMAQNSQRCNNTNRRKRLLLPGTSPVFSFSHGMIANPSRFTTVCVTGAHCCGLSLIFSHSRTTALHKRKTLLTFHPPARRTTVHHFNNWAMQRSRPKA